jgi:AraC-like DNA-binding protein
VRIGNTSASRPVDTVPAQFAASLARMLEERGLDGRAACIAAGIDPAALATDAGTEVPAQAYSRLYRAVMTALQDATFGLRREVGMNPGAFRMMCYCLLSCADLGRAIRRMVEFHRVFFGGQLTMVLLTDGGGAARFEMHIAPEARLTASAEPGAMMSAVEAAFCLSMWHRFFGWLIGHPLPLERVELTGRKPRNLDRYRKLFNCTLAFDAAVPAFRFPAEYLGYRLVHNEDSLREFLRTAPYPLLVMPADAGRLSLVDQVRALIGHDFSRGFPSFERITELLHMSAPTLRRRLKREGTTFQELKDNCRRDASIAYLDRPELSINDVAILMGFTDPSAFYRSFKKWTGRTPGEYRSCNAPADRPVAARARPR